AGEVESFKIFKGFAPFGEGEEGLREVGEISPGVGDLAVRVEADLSFFGFAQDQLVEEIAERVTVEIAGPQDDCLEISGTCGRLKGGFHALANLAAIGVWVLRGGGG